MKLIHLIVLLLLSNAVMAKQIIVCKTCEVKTVKEAILKADTGDQICIKQGVYFENNLVVEKPLNITGEAGTILDGGNKDGVFFIKSDYFSIGNLKIKNVATNYIQDNAAIKLHRVNHFKIANVTLEKVFFGILIEKSHHGKIWNNTISSNAKGESGSGNGVHAWHSSHLDIKGNVSFGMRDGIYFEFVSKSKIYNNLSHDNLRYGLHFMFSNNNIYHHNEFRNNGAGVAVMFSKFIDMHHNRFKLNWGTASYGLLLKEIYDANIHHNIFEQNTIGINAEGSTRINFTSNTFLRNGWAVKIAGACYKNIYTKNDFLHNALDLSYNSKLNDNEFDNNYWSEYNGYDLDKDGIGDVSYRPVKLFSYVINKTPENIILLRSLFVDILNFSEKVSPVFTPDDLMDKNPKMKRINDKI